MKIKRRWIKIPQSKNVPGNYLFDENTGTIFCTDTDKAISAEESLSFFVSWLLDGTVITYVNEEGQEKWTFKP